jgi:hypothetical protein
MAVWNIAEKYLPQAIATARRDAERQARTRLLTDTGGGDTRRYR